MALNVLDSVWFGKQTVEEMVPKFNMSLDALTAKNERLLAETKG